ncbi:MAG: hypothetical protein WC371_04220 [Parachlamydiales bacterium]|jgi:tetratricopeptide (TPR) repeat protein
MTAILEKESKGLQRSYKNTILQFQKITGFLTLLKLSFFGLVFFEAALAGLFALYAANSFLMAIALGGAVLTIFSYFVLLFYFQTKKPEQVLELKERFVDLLRSLTPVPKKTAEHHLTVASSLMRLSFQMQNAESEYPLFEKVRKYEFFRSYAEKLSAFFHREDVFKMQELLLCSAVQEHVEQIKATPTDLEVHASLAHSYSTLAKLYLEYRKKNRFKKARQYVEERFETTSKRAIEEFEILKEFAPSDPWIHAQLAQCYHSLEMFEEEGKEYEVILELSPDDQEVLFRLGAIYFQLGKNALGLKVYSDLKRLGYKRADELLELYASIKSAEELELVF